ncbi:MAG: BCD family MFS transporter [Polaromonas sp.]|nr:BCD family MFS transporter [Polaromonas sp.]
MTNFGWASIARLGLVQACLGSIVVLTTSTLNRVMVIELALPALLPGLLVAFHYAVQITRPRMGHGSDVGGRRTPWIVGGMALLGLGGVLASIATAWMASQRGPGIALAVLAFGLIGLGVSASGTSLLVLLAKRVVPERRAAAATMVWLMMIAGFVVTASTTGQLLDPYSHTRLVLVTVGVALVAFCTTLLAVYKLEGDAQHEAPTLASGPAASKPGFREALGQVWVEPEARRFTIFVFVSMLAYSAQDLILEPFAGTVFGFTPGQSTSLAGLQHGGVLVGMLLAAFAGTQFGGRQIGTLRGWMVGGCLASAVALSGLVIAGVSGPPWPLNFNVFALGVANGSFSIAAIASMMRLASEGREAREGTRMGLWGASQAIAFGVGGLLGAVGSDLARRWMASSGAAYALVFLLEALLFVLAAALAMRIATGQPVRASRSIPNIPSVKFPRAQCVDMKEVM